VKLNLGAKGQYDMSRYTKVVDFVVSALEKILWKNAVTPNRINFSLPLPGRKLDIKTLNVTSKGKHHDAAQDNIEKEKN